MELSLAIKLIEGGVDKISPQVWADFGAGSGLFTTALSTLLPEKSNIYAIDKDEHALSSFELNTDLIKLTKIAGDFLDESIALKPLDGILLANALHFVEHKALFISHLKTIIKPKGKIILIEYDMNESNHWIPYPINFSELKKLGLTVGFTSIIKLTETPSRYNAQVMYSALMF